MSSHSNNADHIAFDFTVPSQDDQYMQARRAATSSRDPNVMRRKRSPSREEDEEFEEDGEDDDEYVPRGVDGGGYSGQQYGGGGLHFGGVDSFEVGSSNERDAQLHGGSTSSASKGALRKGPGVKAASLGHDGQPPPKKKRRRQALSCTECKRRKIRCDRQQPCAPCTRRGEGDKCKWNILEPVEKFVTRKEYDEIKDSLSRLETILTTSNGSGNPGTTEEVAAAVNIVKSKAVLLGKVISSTPAAQQPSSQTTQTTSGVNPLNSVASSRATGTIVHTDMGSGMMNSSNAGVSPFSYQGYGLSVPSHEQGRREYFGSDAQRRQSISQSTPASYAHSPLVPSPSPSQTTPQYPHSTLPGHYSSSYPQQRVPQIDLGGIVVEDQSASRISMNNPSSSLSTLASLANSSSRPITLQPIPQGRSMEILSPSLTLAPIGANAHGPAPMSVRGVDQRNLTIAVPPTPMPAAMSGTAIPSIAPPRLPVQSKTAREAELKWVLQSSLPRREVCDRLVDYYFEKVEWAICLLHRNSFLRASEAFWFLSEDERANILSPGTPASATSWGAGFRASFLPPSAQYASSFASSQRPSSRPKVPNTQKPNEDENAVTPFWISLLLAVLCVSLEKMGFYDSKTLGVTESVEDYKRLCRSLYESSQTVLILGDFLNSRALETVQTLVLHLHCQQSLPTIHWEAQTAVTLSTAVRISQIMGLHKLSPEKLGVARRPGLLKRELGRRAWWNLIERDWSLAPRVGHAYIVNAAQNYCDLPANLDWEELEMGQAAFVQQQQSIWTTASSLLARIDQARILRELIDRYNSVEGVSYQSTLRYQELLLEAACRAPKILTMPDADTEESEGHRRWDRLQFTLQGRHAVISLHRPYFIAALLERRSLTPKEANKPLGTMAPPPPPRRQPLYSRSLESSLISADSILDIVEECKAADHPGIQWWQNTIYIYSAAVVLLAERWYSDEPKPGSLEADDADNRRRNVVAAIALLREQGDSIDIFAEGAAALEALLEATTSARKKARQAARRGMDISDVVNPVNVSTRSQVSGVPTFVRSWIDRTSIPPTPPMPLIDQQSSLSTISMFPGEPLLVDSTNEDAQFWARLFDLDFEDPLEAKEMFYPSEVLGQQGNGDEGDGMVTSASEGERSTRNDAGTGLGASAIWGAMSGPIGSMANGDAWARASPYEQLK